MESERISIWYLIGFVFSNRGTLGAMLILSETIGILLIFIFGNYCDYYTPPKVAIALAALCGVLLIFFPESPSFLMKQNRILVSVNRFFSTSLVWFVWIDCVFVCFQEAERSIRFYQNLNEKNTDYAQLQMEIRKLQSTCDDATNAAGSSSMKWSDLTKRPASKAIIIGLVLALLDQLCGVFAMLNYTANVFEEAGSSMSANKSAIVVGAICTIGSYVSTYLVDRAGRKVNICTFCLNSNIWNCKIIGHFRFCLQCQQLGQRLVWRYWAPMYCLNPNTMRWTHSIGFRWSVFRLLYLSLHWAFWIYHSWLSQRWCRRILANLAFRCQWRCCGQPHLL